MAVFGFGYILSSGTFLLWDIDLYPNRPEFGLELPHLMIALGQMAATPVFGPQYERAGSVAALPCDGDQRRHLPCRPGQYSSHPVPVGPVEMVIDYCYSARQPLSNDWQVEHVVHDHLPRIFPRDQIMRLWQVLLFAIMVPISAVGADGSDARCEITARDEQVDGICRFSPRQRGSFDIAMVDGRQMGGATALSLDVLSTGVGEVRGLTPFGVRSRWGEARRMDEDGACWRGSDFTLCVRAFSDLPAPVSGPQVFAGRCHKNVCTWVDQLPAREIGTGSPAVPGRLVETTARLAQSQHRGGRYPASPPADLSWSAPEPVQFFCSTTRPAFLDRDGSWTVLPFPDVFGATESITRRYLHACHPGTKASDPYQSLATLGYAGKPTGRDLYPDFATLIRG